LGDLQGRRRLPHSVIRHQGRMQTDYGTMLQPLACALPGCSSVAHDGFRTERCHPGHTNRAVAGPGRTVGTAMGRTRRCWCSTTTTSAPPRRVDSVRTEREGDAGDEGDDVLFGDCSRAEGRTCMRSCAR